MACVLRNAWVCGGRALCAARMLRVCLWRACVPGDCRRRRRCRWAVVVSTEELDIVQCQVLVCIGRPQTHREHHRRCHRAGDVGSERRRNQVQSDSIADAVQVGVDGQLAVVVRTLGVAAELEHGHRKGAIDGCLHANEVIELKLSLWSPSKLAGEDQRARA